MTAILTWDQPGVVWDEPGALWDGGATVDETDELDPEAALVHKFSSLSSSQRADYLDVLETS